MHYQFLRRNENKTHQKSEYAVIKLQPALEKISAPPSRTVILGSDNLAAILVISNSNL